jgi:Protein of unknown function (DUF3224)
VTRNIHRAVIATGLAALAVAAPAFGASSHKVKMDAVSGKTGPGTHISATFKGKPFGTCKMTGQTVIPQVYETWKCTRGSFKLVGKGTTGASNDSKGTWKIVKGSGKGGLKGITGAGTYYGLLSTGLFHYRGTVKY